jgi:hypothetical protein
MKKSGRLARQKWQGIISREFFPISVLDCEEFDHPKHYSEVISFVIPFRVEKSLHDGLFHANHTFSRRFITY